MTEPQKPIAQLAYETFVERIATVEPDEALHAPRWSELPERVRVVIAEAVAAGVRSFAPALVVDIDPSEQAFAQVGYQAYIGSTGGLNYQGLPCPAWDALPSSIQTAWAVAALAIRNEHEHRLATEFDLDCSADELKVLIAGLDALQVANKHDSEILFPLRSRLRAIAYPPETAPEAEEDAFPVTETAPELPPASNEDEKPEPTAQEDAPEATQEPKMAVELPAPGLPGIEPVSDATETLPVETEAAPSIHVSDDQLASHTAAATTETK